MKYTKTAEAEVYTGELAPMKKFLGIKDAQYDKETRVLIIPEDPTKPDGMKWTAYPGDGVEILPTGNIIVYKQERFEREFTLQVDTSKGKPEQKVQERPKLPEEASKPEAENK